MTKRYFQIGDHVEGGKGEDYDHGIVVAHLDPPEGECDVVVAWKSGVRTPAASCDLTEY